MDKLFAVFSSKKPNCLTEMNLKETSKWKIEKKLKRAAFIQDGESSQAAIHKDSCFWKSLSHLNGSMIP